MVVESENLTQQNFVDKNGYVVIDVNNEDREKQETSISEETEFKKCEINNLASVEEKYDSETAEDVNTGEDVLDSNITEKQSNTYAAKKTVAQGMMDIALITANANQLRYIIEFNSHSSTYYLNLFLIVISLILQIGVGVSLIFKGRLDLRGQSKDKTAKKINNYVVIGIFLVTIINVFIASFTITNTK
ncbi:ninjurin-B-like [Tenebrio molitor]|uniref:ninjurin-B-like n=1 Tax=Tenebrio molitor TaxID=7067 RepID=UPI001C3A1D5E|nr:unnamed protein product [Tenebrio molitor]